MELEGVGKGRAGGARGGAHALPEEVMVPGLCRVVEQRGLALVLARLHDELLQRQRLHVGPFIGDEDGD